MKIADTSAQDIVVQAKPKTRQRVLLATGILVLILMTGLAVPSLQRWAGSSISVPRERLRLAIVERQDLVRDVSVQGRIVAAISRP